MPDDADASTLRAPSSITDTEARNPVDAPLHGDPKARNRLTYDTVIDQFAVEKNPRYRPRAYDKVVNQFVAAEEDPRYGPRENFTFCNTFVWDVTRAMRAEIPYWVGTHGEPRKLWETDQGWMVFSPAYAMSANDMNRWLNRCTSPWCSWREVSAEEAQALANLGHPAVASATEPNGEGHIAIVRPGSMSNGPAIAQAGTTNVNYAHAYDFFPREGTQFFVDDKGDEAG